MPTLQFVVYDRYNGAIEDISDYVLEKQVTRRLNRPSSARGRMPTFLASALSCGDACLKVRQDGTLIHNGIIWFIDDDGDENTAYTEFISVDPLIWTRYRYARDDDDDFSDPQFFRELEEGPTIVQHLIDNTLTWDDLFDPLPGVTGDTAFGLTTVGGTFETGGMSMAGAPADWPMTIADAIKLMTDTGGLDVVVDPVDDGDGYPDYVMGVINAYNGDYGSDLTGSSIWNFATGNKNVRHIKRTLDMSTIGNASRMFLGPKLDIQHWTYEIDATNPFLPNTVFIQALAAASRNAYGKFMDIHIYDSMESESEVRWLYHNLFELEMILRTAPREMIDITPNRGIAPNFGLGDIIAFNAGSVLRGGFSGQMRVYEYTVSEDNDGVFAIDKIVASADQESDA